MTSSRIFYLTSLALVAAIALFENRTIARYRRNLDAQSAAFTELDKVIEASRERSSALRRNVADTAMPDDMSGLVDPTEVGEWLEKVKRLRKTFIDQPAQQIPQLAMLNDHEWVAVAREAKFDTDEDIDRALAKARTVSKTRFVGHMHSALARYLDTHHGSLPSNLSELLPFLALLDKENDDTGRAPASDPRMLAQYELKASGKLTDVPDGLVVGERALLNEDLDHRIELEHEKGALIFSESYTTDMAEGTTNDATDESFERSVRAFAAANGGAAPETPADLIPFLNGPLAQSVKEAIAQEPVTPEGVKAFKTGVARLLSTPASK
jgi:hypothetical protein